MSGETKEFNKNVDRNDAYKVYLTILSGTLGLTNKEIDIAARLYHHNENISEHVKDPKLRGQLLFSTEQKRVIREELGISSLLLYNYIKTLKDKRIILEDKGVKYLNDKLDLNTKNGKIELRFNLYLDDDGGEQKDRVGD